jgi:thioredoxin reductase
MAILNFLLPVLLAWGIYYSWSLFVHQQHEIIGNTENMQVLKGTTAAAAAAAAAGPKIYDALIVGGGPAGMSAALALARVCRTSILFDTGEYRNQGAKAMHTFLSRDGIDPVEFRATARQQIQGKYSAQVSFMNTKIVRVSNTEILPGYKGFEATDSANQTFQGRKLVLATGTEDLLPTDVEGYKENWPDHM